MGYEIGSGFMVGLPGQSFDTLASDLLLLCDLDLDMIGNGPFIPNPDTPLGLKSSIVNPQSSIDQVPASTDMTLRALALTRILRPDANLPATTALATLSHGGYEAGLRAGANVIMPQVSPPRFRELYRIYPGVAPLSPVQVFHGVMHDIQSAGRRPGTGPGSRRR
jgi:biotin synthase